ncbi:MAG: metallophosphoesterase family protein [Deltaproteobacteria bacterium]|nr:metallophosphoesterase family protein [Deltaproteobacteria bacterium]
MIPTRRHLIVSALLAALLVASGAQAQTVTRGPYLQIPTPGGIVVRWRTDVPTDSRVAIGAAPGALSSNFDDAVSTTEHEVQLSGLAPDTQYYYSVGTTSGALAGDDASTYFRTSPTPGTVRPIRAWVIGDAGFAGANLNAVRDAYTSFNGGGETDLFLLLGDNAYFTGTDPQHQAAVFDPHAALLRKVAPWPTFGNHEGFSSNSITETGPYFDIFTLPRAGEAGGVSSGTESYYSFDFANVHFIVLDGNSSSTAPGGAMMTWLEADLQATTADWLIAFWHQPPYSKGLFHDSDLEGREIEMREKVLPTLEDYGVDLVLNGHSHSYERSYLIDGHYGFSPTLDPLTMVLDGGDGDPASDGAYRKASVGPTAHEGAVYVVAGSSSEVRNATLNHPAMKVGLLQLGSLVLDIDGNRLTGSFLNNLEQITDTFTIEKGVVACPAAPRTGCDPTPRAQITMRDQADDARDRLVWRFNHSTINPSEIGDPTAQGDIAVCVYEQTGKLVGGSLRPGEGQDPTLGWKKQGQVYDYTDALAAAHGLAKVRVRTDAGLRATGMVRGKGPALGGLSLPLDLPVQAQLVNLDNGACWAATFASALKNDATRFTARTP